MSVFGFTIGPSLEHLTILKRDNAAKEEIEVKQFIADGG